MFTLPLASDVRWNDTGCLASWHGSRYEREAFRVGIREQTRVARQQGMLQPHELGSDIARGCARAGVRVDCTGSRARSVRAPVLSVAQCVKMRAIRGNVWGRGERNEVEKNVELARVKACVCRCVWARIG